MNVDRSARPRWTIVVTGMILGGLAALMPQGVGGQEVDLEASLRCFEEFHRSGEHPVSRRSQCPSRAVPIEPLVRSAHHFGIEVVQEALDRLVEMAYATDSPRVQKAVCTALKRAGLRSGRVTVEGVVERLEGLFFDLPPVTRLWCLSLTPYYQADRTRMIEFLRRVATEPDPPDADWREPASSWAVNGLGTLGAEGRAAIAEILANRTIATGRAEQQAERILERPPGQPPR